MADYSSRNAPHSGVSPAQPLETLLAPRKVDTLPTRIQAPSGRIWEIPFQITHREPFDPNTEIMQIFPSEPIVIRAATEFGLRYAPEHMHDFVSCLKVFQSGWQLKIGLEVLSGKHSEIPAYKNSIPVVVTERAPRHVDVPEISNSHWAYHRHFSPGHGINYRLTEEQWLAASHAEASSDVNIICSYIRHYDRLARRYDAESLMKAVYFASFRDPYKTCMQICVMDLKFPPHFVSLIHYALGFHFLSANNVESLKDGGPACVQYTPEQRAAHHVAYQSGFRLFTELLRLYIEDFA
jgi:hypothetical protein